MLKYEGDYLNGNGKEYNPFDNTLVYEGEYLNGEKHGKGKEYTNGKLLFEGEYKNGKKWNGKAYDINSNKINEVKEGKGYIKEYFYQNKIKSEGEYLNGEKNGKGKEYNMDGLLIFEGEYKNGKKMEKENITKIWKAF